MSLTVNNQLDSINTTSGTLDLSSLSGALTLPQGNLGARPGTPIPGMLRYNTSDTILEYYNGTNWTTPGGGLVGPNPTTNNAIATWAGVFGGTLQNTSVTLDQSGNIAGVVTLTTGNLTVTGSTRPVNGLYLISAGNLGISGNSALALQIINPSSSANYLQIIGATTGTAPAIATTGSDTNVGLTLNTKGVGTFAFTANSNAILSLATSTNSDVNYAQILSNSGGNGTGPIIQTVGSDLNIPLSLAAKGTAAVQIGTNGLVVGSPTSGNKGSGSVNAQALYINGTPVSVSGASVQSSFKNLELGGVNGTIQISIDQILLQNPSLTSYLGTNVQCTINSALSGANGLDTGLIQPNTWYYVYIIYNGATVAALLSASPTTPTMPGGYTFRTGVISAARTDSGGQFLGFIQIGRQWRYKLGSNLATLPLMATGAAGNINTPGWVAIAVGAFVPILAPAIKISVVGIAAGPSLGSIIVAPNTSYGGVSSYSGNFTNPALLQQNGAYDSNNGSIFGDVLLESSNIYWAASASQNSLWCYGFELNI